MEPSPEGYPRLAALQGTYPQLGIYRRFTTLNARNLLYLQAELVDLETCLDEYTKEDCASKDARKKLHNKNWYFLSQGNDGVPDSQWHTMLCVREKLKEYSKMSRIPVCIMCYSWQTDECLFHQRQLATFDQPETGNLEYMKGWLSDPRLGNCALGGLDRNVWKDGKDLLVVKPDVIAADSFSRLLRNPLIALCRILPSGCCGPADIENNIRVYDEKIVIRAADMIGTAISSSLPVLAVAVLYCIQSMLTRLGIVALFTVLFSLALMATTKAKRIEIFAATAA
jgi:hypothetical protein